VIRRLSYRIGLAVASLGSLAGCTGAGGPSFTTIGVDVKPATAALIGPEPLPPPTNQMDLCVRLPVLLGSSVEKQEQVRGLDVAIAATRDTVDVTFPGSGERAHSYSLAQLRNGFSDTINLTVTGEALVVTIASDCTNP
jgi:hypothetical protein